MPEKRGRGLPLFVPTKEQLCVKALASVGTPHEIIAEYLHIDAQTLKKHFRNELAHARITTEVAR